MKEPARILAVALAALAIIGCGEKKVVWQFSISTPADETASAITTDGSSLYFVGTVAKAGAQDQTSWLVTKLSRKDGRELWSHVYKEGTMTAGGDIVADAAGQVYVVGRGNPQGRQMCLVVKYSPDRSILWKKALSVGDKTWGSGVCNVSGGRIAVCGLAGTDANSDHMVALLDAKDGRTIWVKNIDICSTDLAVRIAADSKDNLAIVGQYANAKTPENSDIIVIKLKPNGDTLWTRTYDSGGDDKAGDIAFDPFGNVLVTGTARVADSVHCVILEYDADGGSIRKAAYGQQAQATGRGIFVTKDADIFVTGSLVGEKSRERGNERSEVLAFQYKPSALSVWERHYTPGPNAGGVDLVVSGDVYVAANVEGKAGDIGVYSFSLPAMPVPPAQKPSGQ